MAITTTKAVIAFQASASNSAAGTTTGTAADLTASDGCEINAKCTNGATGPTLPCRYRVQVSNDNSTWYDYYSETAQTGNNVVTTFQPVYLGPEVMYARTVFDSNTGQAVTVVSDGMKVTFT